MGGDAAAQTKDAPALKSGVLRSGKSGAGRRYTVDSTETQNFQQGKAAAFVGKHPMVCLDGHGLYNNF